MREDLPRNRSMPASAVIPELAYSDVGEAAAWLCRAFGFTERLRIGGHRIQLAFGDGALVAVEGESASAERSHGVMVRVSDADAHYRRAVEAGAQTGGPPVAHPYGEKQYNARDPGGHVWTFSETVADIDPADWGGELVG